MNTNNLLSDAIYSLQDVAEELNSIVYYHCVGSEQPKTEFTDAVIDSFETALNQFITTTTMLMRIRGLLDGVDTDGDYIRRLKSELTALGQFIDDATPRNEANHKIVAEVMETEINRLKQENNFLQSKLDLLEEVQAA